MSDANVLPESGTARSDIATQTPKFFSLSDRVGRVRYFVYMLIAILGCGLLMSAIQLFTLALRVDIGQLVSSVSFILIKAVILPTIVFAMSIRRLHDLDFNAWWALLSLLPFVAVILLAWPGQRTSNRYGLPPSPNPGFLTATAVILPALLYIYFYSAVFNTHSESMPALPSSNSETQQTLRSYDEK